MSPDIVIRRVYFVLYIMRMFLYCLSALSRLLLVFAGDVADAAVTIIAVAFTVAFTVTTDATAAETTAVHEQPLINVSPCTAERHC